jgi:hypothetical protein
MINNVDTGNKFTAGGNNTGEQLSPAINLSPVPLINPCD